MATTIKEAVLQKWEIFWHLFPTDKLWQNNACLSLNLKNNTKNRDASKSFANRKPLQNCGFGAFDNSCKMKQLELTT